MRTNHSREERQKIVEEYMQSRKSQTVFAPEHGIKPNTLSAWVTKYRMETAVQSSDVHFVELKSTVISRNQNIVIRKSGIEIEVPITCTPAFLKEILTAVKVQEHHASFCR